MIFKIKRAKARYKEARKLSKLNKIKHKILEYYFRKIKILKIKHFR